MKVFLAVCSALLAQSAWANHGGDWSLGGAIGQSFPTGPTQFSGSEDEKLHGSVWVRRQFHGHLGAELNYNKINFDGRNSGAKDPSIDGFTLNAVWRTPFARRFSALGALGAGLGQIKDYSSDSYSEFYGLARFGVEYAILHNLGLGAHAQFNYLPETSGKAPSEVQSLSYLVSLSYSFGGHQGHDHGQCPADHDCNHDHGKGCRLEHGCNHDQGQGCPVDHKCNHDKTAPVAAPSAPAPASADSDGDGVPDAEDKCSDTPAGAKVNAYGCQDKEKAQVQLNLIFASGKSLITDDQKPQIEDVAKFMKSYPDTKVVIEGHTDNTGNEATNKRLSKARATAVMNSLVKDFGVAAARLKAEGFGSAKPLKGNDSEEGRKANRRVIATISDK